MEKHKGNDEKIIDFREVLKNRRHQGKIKVFKPEGKIIEFPRERVTQEQSIPQENIQTEPQHTQTTNQDNLTEPPAPSPEIQQPVEQVQLPQQVQNPTPNCQPRRSICERQMRIVDLYQAIGMVFRKVPIVGPLLGVLVGLLVGLFDGILLGLISVGWIVVQAV